MMKPSHKFFLLTTAAACGVMCLSPAWAVTKSERKTASKAEQSMAATNKMDVSALMVPLNRSTLITLSAPMAEVLVAQPEIADVHAHNDKNLTVIGKKLGRTNLRIFDKEGKILREVDVTVGHDLPAIRRSLKNFLPDEVIGVEMVNTSVALTGQVKSAQVAEKAVRIVKDFIGHDGAGKKQELSEKDLIEKGDPDIMNMLQITSGQQVMLKVRVGEINREALKNLGVDLNYVTRNVGTGILVGTGTGIGGIAANASGVITNPGTFTLTGSPPTGVRGVIGGRWQPDGVGGSTVGGLLRALERDGLFKLLAEPNLVAISGEEAEFLAGGEIPIPVVQSGSSTSSGNVSIEYKPFGVAVKFTPYVLSENRVRIAVQPEVSEISTENSIRISGFDIPSISTRRAKTTVELAPGESFMIAGLIKDQMRATIDQVPGAKELPVLGALLRSTEFKRNETELVIAVTPYVVDPVKDSAVKLPTDNYRPASQMEMFFYGAISGIPASNGVQAPGLEGPVGFMVD